MTQNDPRSARAFEHRPGYPMSFEPVQRRVRALFAGTTVADSARAMLMREDGHAPVYYFPREDVRLDLLTRTQHSSH